MIKNGSPKSRASVPLRRTLANVYTGPLCLYPLTAKKMLLSPQKPTFDWYIFTLICVITFSFSYSSCLSPHTGSPTEGGCSIF
jgi:hypothetical protein